MNERLKIDVTNPADDKYVARIAVRPVLEGTDRTDHERTLERHIGEHFALRLALDLLDKCPSVPTALVEQVRAIQESVKPTH